MVQASADSERKTLGFMPAAAYMEAAHQGKLWVAVIKTDRGEEYAGHLLFGGGFPRLRIFQIFVKEAWRRDGIGSILLSRLIQEAESFNCMSISARVGDDLTANAFWSRHRFDVVDTLSEDRLVSCHTCYVAYIVIDFSSFDNGEEVGMKRYVVTMEKGERAELEAITRKGSHRSQKVINALILLNCDESEFNDRRASGEAIAGVLRISVRKVDRVKKRFVEGGMEAALDGRQGRRLSYVRKADGEFEARLIALSCGEPPQGRSQWSLRLLADRVVELGYIDKVSHETVRRVLKKTLSNRGGESVG